MGNGHRFGAVGYLFTDMLLLCKRKDKAELKPWLLESLPQCLVGDHPNPKPSPSRSPLTPTPTPTPTPNQVGDVALLDHGVHWG